MTVIRKRQANLLKLVAVFPLHSKVLAKMLEVNIQTVNNDVSYLVGKGVINVSKDVNGSTVSAL